MSANDVIKLNTLTVRANQNTIDDFEVLLDKARSGEVTEYLIVYKENGGYTHSWSETTNLVEQMGAATRMMHLINLRMDVINSDD